jgi:hypothetical protein
MIKYELKKNFLDKELFDSFKKVIFSEVFPWFWRDHQVNSDEGFFGHDFYWLHKPCSPFYERYIVPIIIKLKCNMVSGVRVNCIKKDKNKHFSNFHCDRVFDCTTAIFYMNTNNGYTLLGEKEKIKIESEENKIVIFNSQTKHCAVSQTDTDRRIVINFNYY